MAITSKAMDKDLKDHRIETLEEQVKDMQKIKQDLQNKLLNSEKSVIEKNSQIKVISFLMDSYSKEIKNLQSIIKLDEMEIDKLQNRIETLKDHLFISLVITSILFVLIVCFVIKQSL